MPAMYVVGLTGGIGSGKSTVAGEFRKLGIEVIDADQISRQVVAAGSPALQQIASRFGSGILLASGDLDRKALRAIVFADTAQRQWLESLLHPLIAEGMTARIVNCAADSSGYCMVESPLLLETSQSKLVHRVLVVDVSESSQLQRTLRRDGGTREAVEAIMATQMPRAKRLAAADDILDNDQTLTTLPGRVRKLHQLYLKLAANHESKHTTNC